MLTVACKVAKHKPRDNCPHDVFSILNSTILISFRLLCPLEVSTRSRCSSSRGCSARRGFQTTHFEKHCTAFATTFAYINIAELFCHQCLKRNLFFILLGCDLELTKLYLSLSSERTDILNNFLLPVNGISPEESLIPSMLPSDCNHLPKQSFFQLSFFRNIISLLL